LKNLANTSYGSLTIEPLDFCQEHCGEGRLIKMDAEDQNDEMPKPENGEENEQLDIGPSPKDQSRALAETVISSLIDRLMAEARKRGGTLSLNDIEDLSVEMEKKTEALQAVFQHSFEEYVQSRERATWAKVRKFPFDRVMVQKFVPLFVDQGNVTFAEGGLSRRVLPGFFLAVNKMVGAEYVEYLQNRMQTVVDRHPASDGSGDADWYAVYDDPEAIDLLNEGLIAMVPHFDDVERRCRWFCHVVNTALAPAREDAAQDEKEWQMGGLAFAAMFESLFETLAPLVETPESRIHLNDTYGATTAGNIKLAINEIANFKARH